jgi:nucleotide-binding universal stress UspA family protein
MSNQILAPGETNPTQLEVEMPPRTVLLITDGTMAARSALESAIVAAKEHQSRLVISYLADPAILDSFPERDPAAWQAYAERVLKPLVDHAQAAGVSRVEIITDNYQEDEPLNEMAQRLNAHLTIMGSNLFQED